MDSRIILVMTLPARSLAQTFTVPKHLRPHTLLQPQTVALHPTSNIHDSKLRIAPRRRYVATSPCSGLLGNSLREIEAFAASKDSVQGLGSFLVLGVLNMVGFLVGEDHGTLSVRSQGSYWYIEQ